ncbi:DUF6650 family protein [Paracidobacterium acidisoli]|uniref:Uncharacterized protein n=1 Tax=Paracidobacterium acidisoli TaxID=2303751 RepID=A0A372IJP0_9BACT|nr:DUF6650 family protein [Paracidobacterium acidisoli]MBT9332999.1 hypothetical protein [Paracidobacterium acidisoli]
MASKDQRPLVGSLRAQKAIVTNVAHIYESPVWIPSERDLAVEIVKELENRRTLYNDYELEVPRWVVESVRQMRDVFHQKLLVSRDEGALTSQLRSMRAACRKFLDTVGDHDGPHRVIIENGFQGGPDSWKFFTALGELRAAVGLALSLLMAAYDLTCEEQLARILPADPIEDRKGIKGQQRG